MERVEVLQSVFVEQNSTQYNAGEEVDVPKDIAYRHVETGFMKLKKQTDKPSVDLKKKTN